MIALGGFHIFHHYSPDLEGTFVRINCRINPNDNSLHGRYQVMAFVTLETQQRIVDTMKSVMSGHTDAFTYIPMDRQNGVEITIRTRGNSTDIMIFINCPHDGKIHTTVNRKTFDIFFGMVESDLRKHEKEQKIIEL